MTRRTRKPQSKLEFTAWVLEIQTHEVVYGLIALPPGNDVGPLAEGLTIELECTTHEPFSRMGAPQHLRIIADRAITRVLEGDDVEDDAFLGVGGIIRNDGRNEFVLTLPQDVVLNVAQLIESGSLKHIELQTTDYGSQTVVISFDFSRGKRGAAERQAALNKLQSMVGRPAGEA